MKAQRRRFIVNISSGMQRWAFLFVFLISFPRVQFLALR